MKLLIHLQRTLSYSLIIWAGITQLSLSQDREAGLARTHEILTELELPTWFWAGAHQADSIAHYHKLTSDDLLDQYFKNAASLKAQGGIIDPQKILEDEQLKTIQGLIAEHGEKSQIPMTVFLFTEEHSLALKEDQLEERLTSFFQKNNALVTFYYHNEALRSTGHLIIADQTKDQTERQIIKNWEVDEMFLKTARDASVPVDKFSQIEIYVTELSKRSYWIEQKYIASPLPQGNLADLDGPAPVKPLTNLEHLSLFIEAHLLTIVGLALTITAITWYYLWAKKWRKYVLPVKHMPRRLGAEFGANVSTPLEFSDVKLSLAEQREKARNRDLGDL